MWYAMFVICMNVHMHLCMFIVSNSSGFVSIPCVNVCSIVNCIYNISCDVHDVSEYSWYLISRHVQIEIKNVHGVCKF